MSRLSYRLPPAALLVLACALWGAATVFSKALLSSVPPVTLLVLQLAPSALVLWIMAVVTRARRPRRSHIAPLVLLGILNPGISYTLGLLGLQRISASVSTLLWAAEPLMILALAAVVLREAVSWRLVAVMLVGAFGVTLVGDFFVVEKAGDPVGVSLLLGGVFCCAVYTVYSRKVATEVDPVITVAIQQTAGLAWASALLVGNTRFGSVADLGTLPLERIAAAAGTGLLYYAAAYWLYISALRSVPAAVAGTYFNVIPVFGVGLAFVFLGESLSAVQWAGAGAILLSVFELVRLTGKAQTVEPPRAARA
jgi:drug/metabolite transporter (DMT)-like permease